MADDDNCGPSSGRRTIEVRDDFGCILWYNSLCQDIQKRCGKIAIYAFFVTLYVLADSTARVTRKAFFYRSLPCLKKYVLSAGLKNQQAHSVAIIQNRTGAKRGVKSAGISRKKSIVRLEKEKKLISDIGRRTRGKTIRLLRQEKALTWKRGVVACRRHQSCIVYTAESQPSNTITIWGMRRGIGYLYFQHAAIVTVGHIDDDGRTVGG